MINLRVPFFPISELESNTPFMIQLLIDQEPRNLVMEGVKFV